MLQEEFCGKISDLLVIPTCGGACNIQEDNIVFEDAEYGVFVNFEIVTNSLDTNIPCVRSRLNTIINEIDSEPKRDIMFDQGLMTGKCKSINSCKGQMIILRCICLLSDVFYKTVLFTL